VADQPTYPELDKLRSVEELKNHQAEVKKELDDLNTEFDGLPFPDDARQLFAVKSEEHAEIEKRISELQARKSMLERMAGQEKNVERPDDDLFKSKPSSRELDIYDSRNWIGAPTLERRNQILLDNSRRAVEIMHFPHERADQDGAKHHVTSLLEYSDSADKELALRVLTTGSPQYRTAFSSYVASGGSERGTALAVGVDGTGGFAVPVVFDPTIIGIGAHTSINPYRAACRVVTISGTDTWQALTATAITAAWATEAAAATEQGPTFARPEFIAKRAHAFVTVSYEMSQDRPDLPAELATLFQEAKDNLEENSFTKGAGTTVYPQGMFLDGAFTTKSTVTNDVTAIADIYAIESDLPIRHRANAAWFMNRGMIHTIQGYETVYGPLFGGTQYASVGTVATSSVGNTGLRLLGYPIWEVPSADALPTTDAKINAVFCDPRNYVILDRIGMSVKVIPDMLNGATPSFPTGEIGIYAFWRGTARVLNVDGGRQLKVQ
jgi:HK97 family phage major capsid protein